MYLPPLETQGKIKKQSVTVYVLPKRAFGALTVIASAVLLIPMHSAEATYAPYFLARFHIFHFDVNGDVFTTHVISPLFSLSGTISLLKIASHSAK